MSSNPAISARLALEGQLVQETVLAQELCLAEERQAVQLQELQACDVPDDLEAVQQRIQQLEVTYATYARCESGQEADGLRELKVEEEQAQEALRWQRQSEQAAHEELNALRQSIADLQLQCKAMDCEPAEEVVLQALRAHIPMLSAPLSQVLETLELEKESVAAELQEDQEQLEAWQKAKELAKTMETLEETQRQLQQRSTQVQQEREFQGQGLSEIADLSAEVATLKTENQLLNRQQVEWRRSQSLMLRLAEEMQKNPSEVEPPAEQGPTLAELQIQEVLRGNKELRQRVAMLQKEKEDLINSQRGLESFLRARLPAVDMGRVKKLSAYPPSP